MTLPRSQTAHSRRSAPDRGEHRQAARTFKQRLGIETDHEAQIFGQGLTFFHIENWYSAHSIIRTLLKLTGLYWRGRANAARVQVRHNDIRFSKLPPAFDGFTLLHANKKPRQSPGPSEGVLTGARV